MDQRFMRNAVRVADPPGDFTEVGAPRWKQRALYDALKELIALNTPEVSLVRLATVDVAAGVELVTLWKDALP